MASYFEEGVLELPTSGAAFRAAMVVVVETPVLLVMAETPVLLVMVETPVLLAVAVVVMLAVFLPP